MRIWYVYPNTCSHWIEARQVEVLNVYQRNDIIRMIGSQRLLGCIVEFGAPHKTSCKLNFLVFVTTNNHVFNVPQWNDRIRQRQKQQPPPPPPQMKQQQLENWLLFSKLSYSWYTLYLSGNILIHTAPQYDNSVDKTLAQHASVCTLIANVTIIKIIRNDDAAAAVVIDVFYWPYFASRSTMLSWLKPEMRKQAFVSAKKFYFILCKPIRPYYTSYNLPWQIQYLTLKNDMSRKRKKIPKRIKNGWMFWRKKTAHDKCTFNTFLHKIKTHIRCSTIRTVNECVLVKCAMCIMCWFIFCVFSFFIASPE